MINACLSEIKLLEKNGLVIIDVTTINMQFKCRWRMIEGEKASMLKENKKEQHNLDSTIENPV
ncbi:hypothetical protein CsSME_00009396 [Camellia sinensis var. sinensis]